MANPEREKRAAFEILGLDHVVLRVKDLQRLTRFYCEVIGCSVERERPELGLMQLRAGVSLIDLVSVDGEPGRRDGRAGPGAAGRDGAWVADPSAEISRDKRLQATAPGSEGRNMDHLCLRIEPFDESALVAHLISNGVGVGEIITRFGADGYGPSLYISDPEGNVIELKGPPTRAGA